MRERALRRAEAALLERSTTQRLTPAPRVMGKRTARLVVAPILLAAICALAFEAVNQVQHWVSAVPILASPFTQPRPEPQAWISLPLPLPSDIALPVSTDATAANSKLTDSANAAPSDTDIYSRELQVLQPAQRAVARKDFAAALGPIAEHQRQFPGGALTEEREALRVKTLLGLGRVAEARRAAAGFRKRFPRSALLGKIEVLLETEQ